MFIQTHKINITHKWTDDKKNHTLLTRSDGLDQPISVVYRETDDTIVVGCAGSNNLCLYTNSQNKYHTEGLNNWQWTIPRPHNHIQVGNNILFLV